MLKKDTRWRLTAEEALNHTFFDEEKQDQRNNLFNELSNLDQFYTDKLRSQVEQYKDLAALKKYAISYIVTTLATDDEKKIPNMIFKALDKDHDGVLSKDDLEKS